MSEYILEFLRYNWIYSSNFNPFYKIGGSKLNWASGLGEICQEIYAENNFIAVLYEE